MPTRKIITSKIYERSTCQTSLAATYATAAEMSRRGYNVAFTVGNTPRVDLYCDAPDGQVFKVQVKGISNPNGFYVQQSFFDSPAQQNLLLVIVLVPKPNDDSPVQFFVMTHAEAIAESEKMPKFKRDGRPYEKGSGLNWGSITPYKNAWYKLPTCDSSSIA
jgi:hypothetical protein